MKRIFIAGAFILFTVIVHAQNVGIGVPVPLQKLDVGGAVKIGTTATNQPDLSVLMQVSLKEVMEQIGKVLKGCLQKPLFLHGRRILQL